MTRYILLILAALLVAGTAYAGWGDKWGGGKGWSGGGYRSAGGCELPFTLPCEL